MSVDNPSKGEMVFKKLNFKTCRKVLINIKNRDAYGFVNTVVFLCVYSRVYIGLKL